MEAKTSRVEEFYKKALDLEKQRTQEARVDVVKANKAQDLEKQRADEAVAALQRPKPLTKQPDFIGKASSTRITNKLGMRFVPVPRGTFWMGGGNGKPGDKQVAISDDFYLGETTVTQGQWRAVMGTNPSWFVKNSALKVQGNADVKNIPDEELDQFPVEGATWENVQQFLAKLNEMDKGNGRTYRLPSEAEWEYACRGGATSKEECSFDFYFTRSTNDLSSREANFNGRFPTGNAATGPNLRRPCKVASYQPNRLGLFDMHGNVSQWCQDSFEDGTVRVVRGGAWYSPAQDCRAASRRLSRSGARFNVLDYTGIGFRLVLVPLGKEGK